MKATLEFTLPEERAEFEAASAAGALCSALYDIDNHFRDKVKYSADDTFVTVYEEVREDILDLMRNNGVSDLLYE